MCANPIYSNDVLVLLGSFCGISKYQEDTESLEEEPCFYLYIGAVEVPDCQDIQYEFHKDGSVTFADDPRGEGPWKKIGWKEAVADIMKRIGDKIIFLAEHCEDWGKIWYPEDWYKSSIELIGIALVGLCPFLFNSYKPEKADLVLEKFINRKPPIFRLVYNSVDRLWKNQNNAKINI